MAKKNILIVEDEFIVAIDLQTQLNSMGNFFFHIVASGEEAVKITMKKNINLIFMDIKLKGEIDGLEAAGEITKKQDVPVIFISGNSDLLNSDRLKKTKPAGILNKPIMNYELVEVLNNVFSNKD